MCHGRRGGRCNRRQEFARKRRPRADLMIYTTEDCNMEDPAVICAIKHIDARGRRAQDYPDRYDAIYQAL